MATFGGAFAYQATSALEQADESKRQQPFARRGSRRLGTLMEGPGTVVEFVGSDGEAWAKADPVVAGLHKKDDGKVTFEAPYLPIPRHANANNAACAVESAARRGEFEYMSRGMFETQSDWGDLQEFKASLFCSWAEHLVLDMARYDIDVVCPDVAARVKKDVDDCTELGVRDAPSFSPTVNASFCRVPASSHRLSTTPWGIKDVGTVATAGSSHPATAPKVWAVSLAGMAAVSLLVLWPGSAQADTALTGSGPSESETIEVLPAEVFLDLNEEVLDPPSIVVTKSGGTRVNSDIVQVSGRRVTSKIVRDVGPGTYTMNYQVVSVDTYSVTGAISFTVTGSTSDPVSPRQDEGEQSREGVTVDAVPDESSSGGSLMIFVLFVVAMVVMLWFLRTGMQGARASGRDETVDDD